MRTSSLMSSFQLPLRPPAAPAAIVLSCTPSAGTSRKSSCGITAPRLSLPSPPGLISSSSSQATSGGPLLRVNGVFVLNRGRERENSTKTSIKPASACTGSSSLTTLGRRSGCEQHRRGRARKLHGWKSYRGFRRTMELFSPQLMDTMPFRFLTEYHPTPLRGVKDSVSPICFWGFGDNKPVVEVVQAGDPVLHEPAAEVRVEDIGSARIEKIINDMVATMRNAPGVGLAAPQIGVQLQIIVLEDTRELMSYASVEECEAQQRQPFDLLVIINPKLKTKSGSGTAVFFEGCLSVDGYRALVERDLEVEVTGLGRNGRPVRVEASGWKARILQHECDHLLGDLYVDKMVPRTFRTKDNLRLPLPSGCPKPGVCKHSIKSFIK